MTSIHDVKPEIAPATLSDESLNELYGEIGRNNSPGYLQQLRSPDFIPATEAELRYRSIIRVMERRGLL